MATERVGALRYDVVLNTHSMKKGASDARSALKTFRDGMKSATTATERYQAGMENVKRLFKDKSITKEQGATLVRELNKELEKEGFRRTGINKFEKTKVKLLQEELELQKKINRESELEKQIQNEKNKREKEAFVKRRDKSQLEHRRVLDRHFQIQKANAKGHKLFMLNLRERMRMMNKMSPGMQAGILGNIAGGLGASGATIGAVRAGAQMGLRFAGPIAAIAGIGLAAKSAVTQADRLKRITLDLTVLMNNNADAADRMVKQFQSLARRTPLTTSVLADGARQLLAFGRSSQFVVKDLEKLATIAGGDTERLRLLTKAFADVVAAGKLQGQELRQFTNQGFNPLREMADMTGRSYASLRKQMEDGAFTADMTSNTLGNAAERYSGRLEASMETVTAQWQKFKGLMSEIGAAIGESGLQQATVATLKGLNNFASNLQRLTGNAADDIAEVFRGNKMQRLFGSIGSDLKYAFDPRQLTGRFGQKQQGFFEQTRKTFMSIAKGEKSALGITKESVKEEAKKSNWTKRRFDIETKYNDLLAKEKSELEKIKREINGVTDLDLLRVEAVRDLSSARKEGRDLGRGDRGIKQAKDNLAIVEKMIAVRDRAEDLQNREQERRDHEVKLHRDKLKDIAEIRKKKTEAISEEFKKQQELADLASKRGGPSDDFTAAGADYRFVQQRRNELEARRIQEKADKKREQQLEEANDINRRQLELEETRHNEMMSKLEVVN